MKLCEYVVSVTNITDGSISEVEMVTVTECSVPKVTDWKVLTQHSPRPTRGESEGWKEQNTHTQNRVAMKQILYLPFRTMVNVHPGYRAV